MNPKKKTIRTAVALGCLLLTGSMCFPNAATAADPITLAVFFAGLRSTLSQAMNDARNAGDQIAIQAGRQALLVLAESEAAYSASMDKTFDRLDATTVNTLNNLKSSVDQILNRTIPATQEFTSHLESIVQQLPFRTHEPIPRAVQPHFVALNNNPSQNVTVRVIGAFDHSGRAGYTPDLKIGQRAFAPTSVTSNQITFAIPAGLMKADVEDAKYSFSKATLDIPWSRSCGPFGLFECKTINTYPVLIGLLPASPGEISIEYVVKESSTATRHYFGVNHHTSSQREAGNNDQDVRHVDSADPGCTILTDTVQFKGGGHGDHACHLESKDTKTVVTRHITIHKSWGASGVCDTSIEFDQVCPAPDKNVTLPPVEVNASTKTNIRWGDRQLFRVPDNAVSWTVNFHSFDGRKLQFGAPATDAKNQFVIGHEGHSIVIQAADEYSLDAI